MNTFTGKCSENYSHNPLKISVRWFIVKVLGDAAFRKLSPFASIFE